MSPVLITGVWFTSRFPPKLSLTTTSVQSSPESFVTVIWNAYVTNSPTSMMLSPSSIMAACLQITSPSLQTWSDTSKTKLSSHNAESKIASWSSIIRNCQETVVPASPDTSITFVYFGVIAFMLVSSGVGVAGGTFEKGAAWLVVTGSLFGNSNKFP